MDKVPNVLFINHSIRDGGPGKSLFYILQYINRSKINPYVIIPSDNVFSERLKSHDIYENIILEKRFPENLKRPRFDGNKEQTELGQSSLYVNLLKFLSILLNIFDLISLIATSRSLIRKKRIDLIYCNGTQAKIVGAFMGLLGGCPVIWHVRNIQQTRFLSTVMNTLAAFPSVKRIICVSGPTAAQFPYGKDKLRVIHNSINVEEYNPQTTRGNIRSEYGLSDNTVIVGSTGRIVPRKGYEYFIRAAGKVIEKMDTNENDVKFVIVGDTPYFFQDNHLAYLKKLVTDNKLDDKFIFTGFKGDVRPCLKDFDIFVIPSNYPDPFPRSVVEAMSFALPVIGFKAGGIVESVDNGMTGFLSEQSDVEGMSDSILKLITDEAQRVSMGKAGRKRVINNFSADQRTLDIENNILEVLGQN